MKPDIDFEEVIFDHFHPGREPLERPLGRGIFWSLTAAAVFVHLLVLGRLIFLNIARGALYEERSAANVNEERIIPAQRGIITDRLGKALVKNNPSFSVSLNIPELIKNRAMFNETIIRLSEILGKPREEIEKIVETADLEQKSTAVVNRNLSVDQVINLKTLALSGVQIENDYRRQYLDGPIFSHILGYVGLAEDGSYWQGRSGLEAFYDEQLRGKDGQLVVFRDVRGGAIDEKITAEAKSGEEVVITIDAEFQKYFYERLKSGLRSLEKEAGVGLALNPQNGEILALVSLPEYDNNHPADYLQAAHQPLFNRAISGVYSPGSTIKPLVALAALKEKVITPDFSVYSPGYLELPNPFHPESPSRFLDWKAHGLVNLHSALAASSNVYFYVVGGGYKNIKGLGIERLYEYWHKFNLHQPTGVDLPGEATGFLPDPEEKEKRTGQIWRIGDTYNVSIGQGELTLTPIRLLSFMAALANGGKMYRPHLLGDSPPEVELDFSSWGEPLEEVRQGLERAVREPYGTARLLSGLPFTSAGKTGSAQIAGNTKTNAFFIGYTPAEDPQIAILILVEEAREGSSNTLPIARDILEWYYYNRLQ